MINAYPCGWFVTILVWIITILVALPIAIALIGLAGTTIYFTGGFIIYGVVAVFEFISDMNKKRKTKASQSQKETDLKLIKIN